METTRLTCPRLGHFVIPRAGFKGAGTGEGLIVDTRGIEVMVMQSADGEMVWVRRDQVEVLKWA